MQKHDTKMEIPDEIPNQKAIVSALRKNIILLEDDNKSKEVAVIHRVLLFTPSIRKQMDFQQIDSFIREFISDSSPFKKEMLSITAKYLEVVTDVVTSSKPSRDVVDYYLGSILVYQLFCINKYDDCYTLIRMFIDHFHSIAYMDKQKEYILNRIYTYLMLLYNHNYSIPNLLTGILSDYRVSCLHNNHIVCSCLYNCILRVYVQQRQYMTAANFFRKSEFPCNVSDKQYVRYSYYKALVSTVLLDYSEAEHCIFSIHKKSGGQEKGSFHEEVFKLNILVKLLIGEKPDLEQMPNVRSVRPYINLAAVVLKGDLSAFRRVVELKGDVFRRDGLACIVNRLHNTVIRIALVKLSKSYSRISLSEIATVLELGGEEEARYTCMRNIRDGIINGRIEGEFFVTEEDVNLITTSRPKEIFGRKISFCLNLRKEILKSV